MIRYVVCQMILENIIENNIEDFKLGLNTLDLSMF